MISLTAAIVETIMYYIGLNNLSRYVAPNEHIFFPSVMWDVVVERSFDLLVFALLFFLTIVSSYPLEKQKRFETSIPEIVLGLIQSLVATDFALRFVLDVPVAEGYIAATLLSYVVGTGLYLMLLASWRFLGLRPMSFVWILVGFTCYVVVFQRYVQDSILFNPVKLGDWGYYQSGILLFLILFLAVLLFPRIDRLPSTDFIHISLVIILIAVMTVIIDYFFSMSQQGRLYVDSVLIGNGFEVSEQRRSELIGFIQIHLMVRDILFLLLGVVSTFVWAGFRSR